MSDSDLFRFPRCVNRYNFDPTSLTALLPNRLVSKEAKISSHTIGREYTYMAAPAFLDQSKCHFHLIGSRCLCALERGIFLVLLLIRPLGKALKLIG
jgi:hypothetical protein